MVSTLERSPIDNPDMIETGIWGWGGHSCLANHGTVQACTAACDPAPGLAPSPLATACHCRHDSTPAPGPPSLLGSLWSGSRVIRFTPPLNAGSLWSELPLHAGLPSSLRARLPPPPLLLAPSTAARVTASSPLLARRLALRLLPPSLHGGSRYGFFPPPCTAARITASSRGRGRRFQLLIYRGGRFQG